MHFILLPCFLAFAVLVLIAGIFMKSYSSKEGLGKLSRYAASTAIFLGIFIFVASIVMHIMMIVWHKSNGYGYGCGDGDMCSGHGMRGKHHMEYKKNVCNCGSCGEGEMCSCHTRSGKHHMEYKKECACDHCEVKVEKKVVIKE